MNKVVVGMIHMDTLIEYSIIKWTFPLPNGSLFNNNNNLIII